MKKNKLLKSILSIFTGVTTCTIPVALSSCSNIKDEDSKCYELTFDAGEGQIIQGNSIVKVSKETKITFGDVQKPTVIAEGKTFAGWSVDNTQLSNDKVINTNLNIKANYVNTGSTDSYCTITYAAETGVTLTGNTVVAIRKGQPFFTANRPTATKTSATFKYWSNTSGGSKFAESTVISNNITLYPVFEDQLTVSFGQPTGTVVTYEGPTTSTTVSGTTFGSIGRPTPTATNKYFDGWYTDASCTTAISSTDQITRSITVYPKMVSNDWKTLTFEQDTTYVQSYYVSLSQFLYNENMMFISVVDLKFSSVSTSSYQSTPFGTITIPTGYKTLTNQTRFIWSTMESTAGTTTCGVGFLVGNILTLNNAIASTPISFQVTIPITKK